MFIAKIIHNTVIFLLTCFLLSGSVACIPHNSLEIKDLSSTDFIYVYPAERGKTSVSEAGCFIHATLKDSRELKVFVVLRGGGTASGLRDFFAAENFAGQLSLKTDSDILLVFLPMADYSFFFDKGLFEKILPRINNEYRRNNQAVSFSLIGISGGGSLAARLFIQQKIQFQKCFFIYGAIDVRQWKALELKFGINYPEDCFVYLDMGESDPMYSQHLELSSYLTREGYTIKSFHESGNHDRAYARAAMKRIIELY